MSIPRAIIGIDGNCGFALLGENIQEGESEFVEVSLQPGEDLEAAQQRAAWQAFAKLRERLVLLTWAYDRSHPRYMP